VKVGTHEATLPVVRNKRMQPDQQKNKQRIIRGTLEGIACGSEQLGDTLVITCRTPSKWGTYLIHMLTHHGTRWRGERLKEKRQAKRMDSNGPTYYMACFQVNPSKLLTAAAGGCEYRGAFHMQGGNSPMLNTSDVNQNALTAFAAVLLVSPNENCKLVAVTEEKKVAIVERLSRLCAPCFCANRIVGTPETLE
jgi:hypothetical protein